MVIYPIFRSVSGGAAEDKLSLLPLQDAIEAHFSTGGVCRLPAFAVIR